MNSTYYERTAEVQTCKPGGVGGADSWEFALSRLILEHQFNGKAELYNTLINDAFARINPLMEEAIAGSTNTFDSLKRMFVATLVFAATDSEFRAVSHVQTG